MFCHEAVRQKQTWAGAFPKSKGDLVKGIDWCQCQKNPKLVSRGNSQHQAFTILTHKLANAADWWGIAQTLCRWGCNVPSNQALQSLASLPLASWTWTPAAGWKGRWRAQLLPGAHPNTPSVLQEGGKEDSKYPSGSDSHTSLTWEAGRLQFFPWETWNNAQRDNGASFLGKLCNLLYETFLGRDQIGNLQTAELGDPWVHVQFHASRIPRVFLLLFVFGTNVVHNTRLKLL